MRKLFILMILALSIYGAEPVPPNDVKRKLISGELAPSEIAKEYKDEQFKLCFNCTICKAKSFQRFYIRFLQARKILEAQPNTTKGVYSKRKINNGK